MPGTSRASFVNYSILNLIFTESTLFSRFFRRETGLSPTEYRSVQ